MPVREIPIGDISTGAQARASLNEEAIQDYRPAAKAGLLPPIVVFSEDDRLFYLGDGFHRVAAHKAEGQTTIKADVRRGGFREAKLCAAGANDIHGVRRTSPDKRRAVEMLLEDEEWKGATDRWIAEQCHVSHPFVAQVRSIGNSSSSHRTGKDGKKRAVVRKPVILCERCTRTGEIPGCNACKIARKKAKAEAKRKKKESKAQPTEAVDAFKNPIPKGRLDAFKDPWVQDTIDLLAILQTQFLGARLPDGMKKRKKHYPFFDDKDFADACGFVGNYLDQLLEHLKEDRPAGVCPSCAGKGCADCHNSGLVPRKVYQQLKKGKK